MAKSPLPYPHIISLMALHDLFRAYKNLPDPDHITDAAYNRKLSQALMDEEVIDAKGNDSFVIGFRSKPVESEPQKTSGLDVSKLDKIAAKVMKWKGLNDLLKLNTTVDSAWEVFEESIFNTPNHLAHLNEMRYFKFLPENDKTTVLNYLDRRYNELGIIKSKAINYLVYLWDNSYRKTKCSILTINPAQKSATYYYFPEEGNTTAPKSVLITPEYTHGNAILSMNLQDEDPEKSFMRASLMISAFEHQFTSLPVLKGVLTATILNATIPMCCEIACVKCDTYLEAFDVVSGKKPLDPLLSLEVQTKRFDVEDVNVIHPKKLHSFALHQLMEEIWGFYLIEYITLHGATNGPNKLQKGICYIAQDGIVTFKFPAIPEKLKGYVEQHRMRGPNFISISLFLSDPSDRYDVHYKLEINRGFDENDWLRVEHLYGCYVSFSLGTIYKGDIVLIKLDGGGFKKTDRNDRYLKFEDVERDGIDIKESLDVSNPKNINLPNPLDKRGYDILTSRKFDHILPGENQKS